MIESIFFLLLRYSIILMLLCSYKWSSMLIHFFPVITFDPPLETSHNLWFSDVFKKYQKETLRGNRFIYVEHPQSKGYFNADYQLFQNIWWKWSIWRKNCCLLLIIKGVQGLQAFTFCVISVSPLMPGGNKKGHAYWNKLAAFSCRFV